MHITTTLERFNSSTRAWHCHRKKYRRQQTSAWIFFFFFEREKRKFEDKSILRRFFREVFINKKKIKSGISRFYYFCEALLNREPDKSEMKAKNWVYLISDKMTRCIMRFVACLCMKKFALYQMIWKLMLSFTNLFNFEGLLNIFISEFYTVNNLLPNFVIFLQNLIIFCQDLSFFAIFGRFFQAFVFL